MRRFEMAPDRGSWRSPCRRAVDRAPVCADGDYFRKLALRRKVAGDVGLAWGQALAHMKPVFAEVVQCMRGEAAWRTSSFLEQREF